MNINNLNKGFSIIELIVVICILGIIATIGIPSYVKIKQKSDLADASTLLVTLNQNIAQLKYRMMKGNVSKDNITSEISKIINKNVNKNFDVDFRCAKENSCLEYYIYAKPNSNSSIKKGIWLSSRENTTYICSSDVDLETLTDASKNKNCSVH